MSKPLALKLAPKSLDDVIGQSHLLGDGKIISNLVKNKKNLNKLSKEDFTSKLKFKYAHIIGPKKEVDYLKNIIIKDRELK